MRTATAFPSEDLAARAARWEQLKRWERHELGIALRAHGLSYAEIAAIIPVGKGTLSAWCRDVELTDQMRARLAAASQTELARRVRGRHIHEAAVERHDAIRAAARAEVPALMDNPGWVAGLVAYWSEGAKTSRDVRFSNSDPALCRLFVRWVQRWLGAEPDDLVPRLSLHSGQDQAERVAWWSVELGIPVERFGATSIKPEGTGHRKKRLWAGTAAIRVRRSAEMFTRVQGWIEGYAAAACR